MNCCIVSQNSGSQVHRMLAWLPHTDRDVLICQHVGRHMTKNLSANPRAPDCCLALVTARFHGQAEYWKFGNLPGILEVMLGKLRETGPCWRHRNTCLWLITTPDGETSECSDGCSENGCVPSGVGVLQPCSCARLASGAAARRLQVAASPIPQKSLRGR